MGGSGGESPFRYNAAMAADIESRWQRRWAREGTFRSASPAGPLSAGFELVAGRPKCYVLDMFAYPSGIGLHVGHPLGYIATDVFARFQRMNGLDVLHAYGYDAFGLPAEQYAIDTGQHPRVTTEANIAVMRDQLRRLGLGHDARREFSTTDPAYYRWTQWIFTRIFGSWFDERTGRARPVAELVAEFESGHRETPDGRPWADLTDAERRGIVDARRLAYLSDEPVNWCPGLGTVLANEEVTADGRSDVGNYPVYRRPMRQWMLRITAFAERLAADLDLVDWPESVKVMQRNWIGAEATHRMRDWLFSRQRYWGEPFPIVYDAAGLPVVLPDEMLPVELPEITDFRPAPSGDETTDPVPPLGRAAGWASVELDLGAGPQLYRRELNTMPQWAGSCWYYLRYLDPTDDEEFVNPVNERYWMAGPGGPPRREAVSTCTSAESSTRSCTCCTRGSGTRCSMTWARLDLRAFRPAGQPGLHTRRRVHRRARDVRARGRGDDSRRRLPRYRGRPVTRRSGKMGKSLKNGVSPDQIYRQYGADTLRLQEMAMGPIEADRAWRPDDIAGVHRFLQRLWRAVVSEQTGQPVVSDRGAAGRGRCACCTPRSRPCGAISAT